MSSVQVFKTMGSTYLMRYALIIEIDSSCTAACKPFFHKHDLHFIPHYVVNQTCDKKGAESHQLGNWLVNPLNK